MNHLIPYSHHLEILNNLCTGAYKSYSSSWIELTGFVNESECEKVKSEPEFLASGLKLELLLSEIRKSEGH